MASGSRQATPYVRTKWWAGEYTPPTTRRRVSEVIASACGDWLRHGRPRGRCAETLLEVIADAQRIGHDGEPWIDRAAGTKEACIDNVEIIQLVRFAVAKIGRAHV